MIRARLVAVLLLLAIAAPACVRVPPWRRETMAKPGMKDPPSAPVRRGEQHVFEVREASQGGYGQSGGGCGCN